MVGNQEINDIAVDLYEEPLVQRYPGSGAVEHVVPDAGHPTMGSTIKRLGLVSAITQALLDMVRGLTGFFTLTEEERFKAGIYLGEGRDG